MKVQIALSAWGLATMIGMVNREVDGLLEKEKQFHDPSGDTSALLRDFTELLDDLRTGKRRNKVAQKEG